MAKAEKKNIAEKYYTILRSPVVTEKSTLGSQNGQITFNVSIDATKPEIKAAIEALYGVKVTAVNTLVRKGKARRFGGIMGRRSDEKKAMVTLAEGQTIDVAQQV